MIVDSFQHCDKLCERLASLQQVRKTTAYTYRAAPCKQFFALSCFSPLLALAAVVFVQLLLHKLSFAAQLFELAPPVLALCRPLLVREAIQNLHLLFKLVQPNRDIIRAADNTIQNKIAYMSLLLPEHTLRIHQGCECMHLACPFSTYCICVCKS